MISVLIPSRSRPEQARRAHDSLLDMARNPGEVEVLFYLNNDDPLLNEYLKIEFNTPPIIGPDNPTSYSWNLLAKQCTGDLLMMGGDDSVMLTEDWDIKIADAVDEDGISLISFDDGRPELGYPNWCITREWYEITGYFVYPQFIHFCVDTWNTDMAARINRLHYLPDVVYEHRHFKIGKAEKDAIYKRVRGRSGINQYDKRIFTDHTLIRYNTASDLREACHV